MMNLPDPQPPAVLDRLAGLAATTPPLTDPLERIAQAVRTAQCPTLGTDSRVRLLMDAVEMLCQVAQYQAARTEALGTEVAWLRGERP